MIDSMTYSTNQILKRKWFSVDILSSYTYRMHLVSMLPNQTELGKIGVSKMAQFLKESKRKNKKFLRFELNATLLMAVNCYKHNIDGSQLLQTQY